MLSKGLGPQKAARSVPESSLILMEIIPFRIKPSEAEDDFSDIYEFLIKGSDKNAYIIEIFIDDANDLGIVLEQCTCPHYKFRQEICKHIEKSKEILIEFGMLTETINKASLEGKDER